MSACPVLPKYHSKRLWRQGSKLELSHLWHIIKGWWYYHYYTGVIWHGRVMPWCGRWRRKPELLGLSVYYRVGEESSVTCIPGSALSRAPLLLVPYFAASSSATFKGETYYSVFRNPSGGVYNTILLRKKVRKEKECVFFYGYFGVMPKGKLFALGRVSIFAHHNSSYTEVITKLGRLHNRL